jgi:hypothetical protein
MNHLTVFQSYCKLNFLMKQASFTFHGVLKELLRPEKNGQRLIYPFRGEQSAKHLVESLRIPHTEIGVLTANGLPVSPGYLVQNGDAMDIFPFVLVEPLVSPSFLLDNHLGKLATFLRILGFDAAYPRDDPDQKLVQTAVAEERILLSRDRGLLMYKELTCGCCLRSLDPHRQLFEILDRYQLYEQITPFRRCLRCNAVLQPVEKAVILDRLQPLTKQYYDEFHLCPACNQVYWKGSHYDHMQIFLKSLEYE